MPELNNVFDINKAKNFTKKDHGGDTIKNVPGELIAFPENRDKTNAQNMSPAAALTEKELEFVKNHPIAQRLLEERLISFPERPLLPDSETPLYEVCINKNVWDEFEKVMGDLIKNREQKIG